MSTNIKDIVALVTGGASGIGEAVAKMIISNGGKVVIADINKTGPGVAEKLGDNAIFVHMNVTSETDIKEALAKTKEKFGKLNVLVNCAAIFHAERTYELTNQQPHSLETFRKVIDINLTGTFNITRLVIDLMKDNQPDGDNQRGVIINFSSVAGTNVTSPMVAYGVSKAGVIAMTGAIAENLTSLGIRVNAVAPGLTLTPLFNHWKTEVNTGDFPGVALNPMMNPKRYGRPDEMAHTVKFIIENHMINGEVIHVDARYRP